MRFSPLPPPAQIHWAEDKMSAAMTDVPKFPGHYLFTPMTTLARSVQAFLLIFSLASSVDATAEPLMRYRAISLGDTPESVTRQATSEFSFVKPRFPIISTDTLVIDAGDEQGIQSNFCAFAAPAKLQKNCQSVRFFFSTPAQGRLLHMVYVQQGFSPAITLDAFLKTLVEAYGKSRLTFEETIPASRINPESKVMSLIWGGNRTPVGHYRLSPFPYEDNQIIGGKYISASIHYEGDMVNGYGLRIVDSESLKKMNFELETELKKRNAALRKMNEASVKF